MTLANEEKPTLEELAKFLIANCAEGSRPVELVKVQVDCHMISALRDGWLMIAINYKEVKP
jgi:hypothetical protein